MRRAKGYYQLYVARYYREKINAGLAIFSTGSNMNTGEGLFTADNN